MLDTVVVTAAQMRAIEESMFAAGLPVAALMEKVAARITQRLEQLYPVDRFAKVGFLVGPGHNGGDALVVARELWHHGRQISLHLPLENLKPLTLNHWHYAQSLGMISTDIDNLKSCDLIVDGLFGFGLEREITGRVAEIIDKINAWDAAVLSIDMPSGLHTDTGAVLGTAIAANHTLCLGLWKLGILAEAALPYVGQVERIDFDIPLQNIKPHLSIEIGGNHGWWRIEPAIALAQLPTRRSPTIHKYQAGHLLLVVGSGRYGGAAILAGLGARATGVGMLSIAVPESLRDLVLAQLPEALVIPCAETTTGAIAKLPNLDFEKYNAIACGCGLSPDAEVIELILAAKNPLILDADGLNLLAQLDPLELLKQRQYPTILTPHWGEFCRLFPQLKTQQDRLTALQTAVNDTKSIILLKGARTAIGFPTSSSQQVWINPVSTPALARGGSGDVLTGAIAGLVAQGLEASKSAIAATVWHSQTAIWLVSQRTEMGVDPATLAHNLLPFLAIANQIK
jgi:ADP-dependent NAD(P)H-hydrate dehydratase / NAD(P)H-hydrate epimerase